MSLMPPYPLECQVRFWKGNVTLQNELGSTTFGCVIGIPKEWVGTTNLSWNGRSKLKFYSGQLVRHTSPRGEWAWAYVVGMAYVVNTHWESYVVIVENATEPKSAAAEFLRKP